MRAFLLTFFALLAVAPAASQTGRFVVLSDLHAYAQSDGGPGPGDGSPTAGPVSGAACPDCDPRAADTKAPLFESLLADIACQEDAGFDFAVVTGDWLAHYYQNPGQQALKKGVFGIPTQRLRAQFGADTLLIPALGNNDAYQGDYNVQPEGDFLRDVAALWRPLFPTAAHLGTCLDDQPPANLFEKSFLAGGYYAFSNPYLPNNCTLVLNTTLLTADYLYAWRSNGPEAARQQLEWLAARLDEARDADKNVWVLMHVPPGADPWASAHHQGARMLLADGAGQGPDLASQLVTALAEHGDVIRAAFAGHTHDDSFALLRDANGDAAAWVHISPSVTPDHHSGRSAYQIFEYRHQVGRAVLENYVTRHLDFRPPSPKWSQEYNWREAFCHSQCDYDVESLAGVLEALEEPAGREEAEYRRFYAERDGASAPAIDEADWPYYLCAIGNLRKSDYAGCIAP